MSENSPELFVVDIFVAIDKIKRTTNKISFKEFISNECVLDLTVHNLRIIGEVVKHLVEKLNFFEENEEKWKNRYKLICSATWCYFEIDVETIFNEIAKKEIDVWERDLLSQIWLKEIVGEVVRAIKFTKLELEKMYRKESIDYLIKIEKLIKSIHISQPTNYLN